MASEEVYNQLAQQIGPDYVNKISALTGIPTQTTIIILAVGLAIVFIWSLIWKGLALWKSAINRHKIWFVLILVINTVGILEILYIYVFSKMNWNKDNNKNNKDNSVKLNKNFNGNTRKKKKR